MGEPFGQFGQYAAIEVLGEGGQGTVYLGRAPDGTHVAIKVLLGQIARDDDARRRFRREAEAARRVAPFCTARVLDVGVAARPYIVSEYVPGPSLDALVRRDGPRTGGGLQRLGVATLTALDAIHRAGIVHRDFKPSNVIMGQEGPVVIDFGIARALDQTATSGVMGTPAFMAPEQFGGHGLTGAADLFSWAATMVYAATGRYPFRGETMPALMHAILTTEPDLSGVPHDLRPLLQACLAKEPSRRPTAATALGTMTALPKPARPADAAPAPSHPTIAVPVAQGRPTAPAPPARPTVADPRRHAAAPVAEAPGMTSLAGAVFALVAVVPLLYYSVLFALATLDYSASAEPYRLDMPRAIAFSVVVCLLCVAVHHVSMVAALVGLLHIPLSVVFALPSLPGATRAAFREMAGFDVMVLVSLSSVLTALVLLATALPQWRWSRLVAVPAVIGSALMMIGGLTGVLAELRLARPRTGAYTTEALGRLAIGLWVLAAAGMVVAQAVKARRRPSAPRPFPPAAPAGRA
ncbi:serine/threonine-protein kinase [Nonomuraea endophytica]|uniref:Putative Ser/Thr protein kinase n=1 Tax=Nonomuraea endophytica TaxID=714136 RepID=A0A7W8AD26_9ACTN|nr:serine/threonine-protein kinase [Nonomuraea endophytica]MBB5083865.1 putative Ser/Thr protein kinase [Nonomuraea endophytica]